MRETEDECERGCESEEFPSNMPHEDWQRVLSSVVSEVAYSLNVAWKDRQNMEALLYTALKKSFRVNMKDHDNTIAEIYLDKFQKAFPGLEDISIDHKHAHHAKYATMIAKLKSLLEKED